MAAILQFTQNAISPGPGIAMVGVAGLPVTVQSVAPGGGATNTFEMLDVPLNSLVPTGVIYSGPAAACFFSPDAPPGCYRIRLTVTGAGGPFTTIKNFAVPTPVGNLILPSFNSRAAELNFPGNTEGWEQILNEWLLYLLAASGGVGDHKVLVDGADTTPNYLIPKIVAGAGISLAVLNPGFNEQLEITNTGGGGSGDSIEDVANCAVAVTAGQPMAMLATGFLTPADAAVAGRQEVYGLAKAAGGPGAITVVTSGVCAYTGPALTPGIVQYLAVGGGFSTTPPPLATAGRIIFRLGQARAAGSILVNRQFLAYT